MSHSTYNKQWVEAQMALDDLIQIENPPEPPKPEKDRLAAFQLLATMYIKYIQIFRRLENCYDQVVHPQKRRVLRHVLDGTMGRILELKNEMVNLEYSEFHYMDDVLSDLKLTPQDIEMPVPQYFVMERAKALKERQKVLEQILAKVRPQDQESAENYAVTSAADAAVKFSKIFYECLDKKRSALSKLYLDSASLIWNGENVAGKAAIAKYLDSLPGTGGTTVDAVDCHPLPDALTAGQTSMVVVVMGTIKFLVKNPKVVPYTETFVLTSEPSTGGAVVWKIAKDSFRLLE